jgi:hypothetical protein
MYCIAWKTVGATSGSAKISGGLRYFLIQKVRQAHYQVHKPSGKQNQGF